MADIPVRFNHPADNHNITIRLLVATRSHAVPGGCPSSHNHSYLHEADSSPGKFRCFFSPLPTSMFSGYGHVSSVATRLGAGGLFEILTEHGQPRARWQGQTTFETQSPWQYTTITHRPASPIEAVIADTARILRCAAHCNCTFGLFAQYIIPGPKRHATQFTSRASRQTTLRRRL